VKAVALDTVPAGVVVLVTVIGPAVAPAGTVAFSSFADTKVTPAAATPLNLTLDPELKPTPFSWMTVPAAPLDGLKLAIERVGVKHRQRAACQAPVAPGGRPNGQARQRRRRSADDVRLGPNHDAVRCAGPGHAIRLRVTSFGPRAPVGVTCHW
jgi:hypothetical protein